MNSKILLVEDVAIEADDFRQKLEKAGFDVKVVSSGKEALNLIQQGGFDLVLMDIGLDELDGIDTAETIRSGGYDCPVVYLTGYADADTLRRAETTTPYGYVVKSAREEILHIVIKNALARHAAESKLKRGATQPSGSAPTAEELKRLGLLLTECQSLLGTISSKLGSGTAASQ